MKRRLALLGAVALPGAAKAFRAGPPAPAAADIERPVCLGGGPHDFPTGATTCPRCGCAVPAEGNPLD